MKGVSLMFLTESNVREHLIEDQTSTYLSVALSLMQEESESDKAMREFIAEVTTNFKAWYSLSGECRNALVNKEDDEGIYIEAFMDFEGCGSWLGVPAQEQSNKQLYNYLLRIVSD